MSGLHTMLTGMGAATTLGTLVVRLTADSSQLTSGFNRSERSVTQSAANISRAVSRMAIGTGLAMAGIGAASVREFARFDQAITKSTAIMGDLAPEIRREMELTARSLATQGVQSAEQLAESYFFLASAGLDAEQSIAALPVVQSFATAGAFDMARATDLLTDAQSALGLTVEDTAQNMENMNRVSDVLVKANTLANATVEQFSTSLTREAGAALKSFNIDVEEGVAVLAAFADQGVKGEIAGTGLSRILRLATSAAVNNKDAMEELGIEIFDVEGNINNLADIIGMMEDAFDGMSDAQRVAALESIGFSARVQGVIMPLLGASGAIREYERELRDAGGTTQEVTDRQLESFSNQMTMTMNRVREVGLAIGEGLVPMLRALNDQVLSSTETGEDFARTTERIANVFSTTLRVSIGLIGDSIQGWQLLLAGSRLLLISLAEGAVRSFSVATNALTSLMEGTANAVISGINMALRVLNRMVSSLPDWMTPGITTVDEIEWKLDIDTSSVDRAVEVLAASRQDLQAEFTELFDQELFSTRMNREIAETTESLSQMKEEASIEEWGERLGVPDFEAVMEGMRDRTTETFSLMASSVEDSSARMVEGAQNSITAFSDGHVSIEEWSEAIESSVESMGKWRSEMGGALSSTGALQTAVSELQGVLGSQSLEVDVHARRLSHWQVLVEEGVITKKEFDQVVTISTGSLREAIGITETLTGTVESMLPPFDEWRAALEAGVISQEDFDAATAASNERIKESIDLNRFLANSITDGLPNFDDWKDALDQGVISAEDYDDAIRNAFASQSQFIQGTEEFEGLPGMRQGRKRDRAAGLQNLGQADRLSRFGEELVTQEKLLEESYARQRQIILDTIGETKAQELGLIQEMDQRMLEQQAEFNRARNQLILQSSEEIFSNLSTIMGVFAGEQSGIYKAMFGAAKAFAIADASLQMANAMAKALNFGTFPANLAAMAQVAAAGASIASNIQAIQMQGSFLGGGHTGDGSRTGGIDGHGGFPAILHPNEFVVDLQRQGISEHQLNRMISGMRLTDSFLGGGHTGHGSRSGGMDGHGGFPAMLHPNERVIDLEHQDDPTAGGVNVQIHNYTDSKVEVRKSGNGREMEILIKEVENRMASRIHDGKGPLPRSIRAMKGSGRI